MTTSLLNQLSQIVGQAFSNIGIENSFGKVSPSQRRELGQFQCNGALAAAKKVGRNPREIAQEIVSELDKTGLFLELTLAGPGFINMRLNDDFLLGHISDLAEDTHFGCRGEHDSQKVILDYGGPNVAKAMHVGHLRATIIGESLRRLREFLGDDVISDVHFGDWGLPMGLLIKEIEREQPNLPYFDANFTGPYPETSPVTVEQLQELYPAASARSKEDAAFLESARVATFDLQKGRAGYHALWQHMRNISINETRTDFDLLGAQFTEWNGEADTNDHIPEMMTRLKQEGYAEVSEGAIVVDVAEEDDKKKMPPLILEKSDGAVMYGTTDLATIEMRREQHDPDTILYVVDARQSLHFEQVFRAARKCHSIKPECHLEHIGFGTVNGKDGKPLKTRDGGVVRLRSLIEDAIEEARKTVAESGMSDRFDSAELADIATKVGIAAIKYADLYNQRMSNYVFDIERFTKFEGRTGPYQMYAAVRIKSMLRKAKDQGLNEGRLQATHDTERNLMLALAALPEAVKGAAEKNAPNILCDHVYSLSQEFNAFYHECQVLGEPDSVIRASRLRLCAITLRQMEQVLYILGIDVPERM
ncbi:arginine--tRNA ligase [Sneathiella sp. HT1-7]|uniref:arginine--tRNA ligase n=1 Tax=Sneathiella sp. HT1-7 TaxID=2887192 RepID=UPI001D140B05|nr:arginine--tRNA ligase [Sneathiella sp. HT1-7]MCC3304181.1 arginine--tRNA ligase [Sneathiella sp. HT1-7]